MQLVATLTTAEDHERRMVQTGTSLRPLASPTRRRRLPDRASRPPGALVDSQPVLAQEFVQLCLGPATPLETRDQVRELRNVLIVLDVEEPAGARFPVGPIERNIGRRLPLNRPVGTKLEVRSQADVLDADELLEVVVLVEMLIQRHLRAPIAVNQRRFRVAVVEVAERIDADHPTGIRNGDCKPIRDAAHVGIDGGGVRVGGHHGNALRYFDGIQTRLLARVTPDVKKQIALVNLLDQPPAGLGKRLALLETTAAEEIAVVETDPDHPQSELVVRAQVFIHGGEDPAFPQRSVENVSVLPTQHKRYLAGLRSVADIAHGPGNDHLSAILVGELVERAEARASTVLFGKAANRQMHAIGAALVHQIKKFLAH